MSTKIESILGITDDGPALLPLDAGEQYRFGFEMEACIGCHSCEVACAEQNNLPVEVSWRRVGEIEGGDFPNTRRFNLSMACNHCLEPSCLSGCPTNAYVKLDNGIVQHLAEECIGCGYCTWNCPYEVPVMHPGRKIVTKCDMCLPRLGSGELPACVEACPTQAIKVEKVNIASWREEHSEADAPNLPSSEITLSTTRIILPDNVPIETFSASDHDLQPADPHWPLVFTTLLIQIALGIVGATWLVELLARADTSVSVGSALARAAFVAFATAALALVVSLAHLGRPAYAWKALRGLRRSWLSREVALFGAFAGVSMAYAASLFAGSPGVFTSFLGGTAALVGAAGVYASARLYMVPARPVWNSPRTIAAFFLSGMAVGPVVTLGVMGAGHVGQSWAHLLLGISAAGLLGQFLVQLSLLAGLIGRQELEYRGSAHLLVYRFRSLFLLRVGLSVAALGFLAIAAATGAPLPLLVIAGVVCAISELIGRYLFYVTVVSMNMPGSFFRSHR